MKDQTFEVEEKTVDSMLIAGVRMRGRYSECGKGFAQIGRRYGRHICGKAFLLYEFTQVVTGIEVTGVDVSEYGLDNAKEEVRPFLKLAEAKDLPFEDDTFDFVYTLNTLHNLKIADLYRAIQEVERVGKDFAPILIL